MKKSLFLILSIFIFSTQILALNYIKKTRIINVKNQELVENKTIEITGLEILNDTLKNTPKDLAQQQLDAYNLRDIEAFLEPYADDVEVYTFPNTLNYKGKETMRKRYGKMFKNVTNLHCELQNRIVHSNIVIDKERVQFNDKIKEATAIYHIENYKIKKVYFIRQ